MRQAILDTDIYSELLRAKNPQVVAKGSEYRRHHGRFFLSAVTVVEVVRGLQKIGPPARIDDVINSIQAETVLPLDEDIAISAGQISGELERTGQTIGRADPMIAARQSFITSSSYPETIGTSTASFSLDFRCSWITGERSSTASGSYM